MSELTEPQLRRRPAFIQCVCPKHGPTTHLHAAEELDDFCLLPTTAPSACLPMCSCCGVEYIETYEGPCQERRWGVGDRDLGPCPGVVSWRRTAERLYEALREVSDV